MAPRFALVPRSMAARMNLTVSARPSNTASPIRKCPILSSAICGNAAIGSDACVIEPVAGMHFQPEARRASSAPARMQLPLSRRPRRGARRRARRTRRRCGFRSPGRPAPPPPRSAPASAAMNSETRMPASSSAVHHRLELRALRRPRRARLRWCAPSRLSGTRQTACGLVLSAMAIISSVAAISRLSGLSISRLQPGDVVVADVAAVLAQMRGDAVGARRDRELGGAHRIGMASAARVADGGDVVDVDAEAQTGRIHGNFSLRTILSENRFPPFGIMR